MKQVSHSPQFPRKQVKINDSIIFGNGNIPVQTMGNIPYSDIEGLKKQITAVKRTNCSLIRFSARNKEEIRLLASLKDEFESDDFIFVADTHFNLSLSLFACEMGFRKIRINPGNMNEKGLKELSVAAGEKKAVIRIGLNGGSCEQKLGKNYSEKDVAKLFDSSVSCFEENNYSDLILSAKFSDYKFNLSVNKLLYKTFPYPLHIGVTEAGDLIPSIIKHTLFYSELLPQGIGDTIRVSITGDPLKEIEAANEILKILGLKRGINLISCPTCGRTWGNLDKIVQEVKKEITFLEKQYKFEYSLNLAIMGCEVNGPGEAKHADLGISLAKDRAIYFERGERIQEIKLKEIPVFLREKLTEKIKKKIP